MKYGEFAGSDPQFFRLGEPLELECGQVLHNVTLTYHTYGTLRGDNVRWVCHALTASSDVADWWPNTVCKGGMLDPERYFVVCANIIGSCYGSTSPLTVDDMPIVTFRDMARAYQLLSKHLNITNISLIIGGSTGGAQAMEWAYLEPDRFGKMALLATLPTSTAWIQAFSAAQRMAIEASDYSDEGLAAARAVAMLQYRGETAYNLTQSDEESSKLGGYKVESYQRYQGAKLARRFDVRCYMRLLDALDAQDLGRGRGGVEAALGRITTPTVVVGVSSDIMYPAAAMKTMAAMLPRATYHEINSDFGHDGFLVEIPKIASLFEQ